MKEHGSNLATERPAEVVTLFSAALIAVIEAVATGVGLETALIAFVGVAPGFVTWLVELTKKKG